MHPIISKESPFRRLPTDLPRRQILYFDGLRLSAEMAGLSFDRLRNLLVDITERKNPPDDRAIRALADAYSVIDSVHRFRELLQATPGIKHNVAFELFARKTDQVKTLRHVVQHINREVDQIVKEGWAALGTLTWAGPSAATGGPPTAWILQAGTSYAGQLTHGPMIDTYATIPAGEICDIFLKTSGVTVNLSDVLARLRSFISSIEGPLEEFCRDKDRFGSDYQYAFELLPIENDVPSHKSVLK